MERWVLSFTIRPKCESTVPVVALESSGRYSIGGTNSTKEKRSRRKMELPRLGSEETR